MAEIRIGTSTYHYKHAVYVYFDNDDSAYAVDNALTLRKLVAKRSSRAA